MKRVIVTAAKSWCGQWAGYWMVTDPRSRSHLAVVDCFGELVEVQP